MLESVDVPLFSGGVDGGRVAIEDRLVRDALHSVVAFNVNALLFTDTQTKRAGIKILHTPQQAL